MRTKPNLATHHQRTCAECQQLHTDEVQRVHPNRHHIQVIRLRVQGHPTGRGLQRDQCQPHHVAPNKSAANDAHRLPKEDTHDLSVRHAQGFQHTHHRPAFQDEDQQRRGHVDDGNEHHQADDDFNVQVQHAQPRKHLRGLLKDGFRPPTNGKASYTRASTSHNSAPGSTYTSSPLEAACQLPPNRSHAHAPSATNSRIESGMMRSLASRPTAVTMNSAPASGTNDAVAPTTSRVGSHLPESLRWCHWYTGAVPRTEGTQLHGLPLRQHLHFQSPARRLLNPSRRQEHELLIVLQQSRSVGTRQSKVARTNAIGTSDQVNCETIASLKLQPLRLVHRKDCAVLPEVQRCHRP